MSVVVVVPAVAVGATGSESELLGSYSKGAGIPGLLGFVTMLALRGAEISKGFIPFFKKVTCASVGSALADVIYLSLIHI